MSDEGFPQFIKLPPEIQAAIWQKVINVRIITVCVDISARYSRYQSRYEEIPSTQDTILIGLKHLPIELHICRLSRAMVLQSWYYEDPKLHTPEHPLGPGHPLEDTSFTFKISAPHGIVPLITYAYPMQARLSFDFNSDTLHIRTRRHVDVSTSLMLTPPLSYIRHAASCPEPPSLSCNYHFQHPRMLGYGATGSTKFRAGEKPFEYCPKMISVNHIDTHHAFEGMYDLPTRVPSGIPPSHSRQECSLRSRKPVWLLGPPRVEENTPPVQAPGGPPRRRCGDRWDPVNTGFPMVTYPDIGRLLSQEEPIDEAHARRSGLDRILRRLRREAGTARDSDSDYGDEVEDDAGGAELDSDDQAGAQTGAHENDVLPQLIGSIHLDADTTATAKDGSEDQDSEGGVLLPCEREIVESINNILHHEAATDADDEAEDEDSLRHDDDDVVMTTS